MAGPSRLTNVHFSPEEIHTTNPITRDQATLPLRRELGQREKEVLSVLFTLGSANVQQVMKQLSEALAYTTVMTTLDRLFKKGWLQREKRERAFIYSSSLTVHEIQAQQASNLIHHFLSDPAEQPEVLLSCLVDAVDHFDPVMLDQLEYKIRSVRTHAQAPSTDHADHK